MLTASTSSGVEHRSGVRKWPEHEMACPIPKPLQEFDLQEQELRKAGATAWLDLGGRSEVGKMPGQATP